MLATPSGAHMMVQSPFAHSELLFSPGQRTSVPTRYDFHNFLAELEWKLKSSVQSAPPALRRMDFTPAGCLNRNGVQSITSVPTTSQADASVQCRRTSHLVQAFFGLLPSRRRFSAQVGQSGIWQTSSQNGHMSHSRCSSSTSSPSSSQDTFERSTSSMPSVRGEARGELVEAAVLAEAVLATEDVDLLQRQLSAVSSAAGCMSASAFLGLGDWFDKHMRECAFSAGPAPNFAAFPEGRRVCNSGRGGGDVRRVQWERSPGSGLRALRLGVVCCGRHHRGTCLAKNGGR